MSDNETSEIPGIDDGIAGAVYMLRSQGVDTFSSCQGGGSAFGHHFMRPTIWFWGGPEEGRRAEKIADDAGYQVFQLNRAEYERQGERIEFWEIQFVMGAAHRGPLNGDIA